MIKTNYLALSWSTSRGHDTYGYNIARLDDRDTGVRYKCMGGGYDMIGTCIGKWLSTNYQERLLAIADRFKKWDRVNGYTKVENAMYGATVKRIDGVELVQLDGACGDGCMIDIARAIGVRITGNYNKRRRAYDGYFVTDFGSADALIAAEKEEG